MENSKDMVCPVGSPRVASPVGSLELPKSLLQAFTGKRREEELTNITHLPGVVVGAILSRISDPIDVASAFVASRIFWGVAQTAPFRLKLRPSRVGYDALKVATWTRTALSSIRRIMNSTQVLDLADCPILDEDVAALVVDLTRLEQLILDGCQKLTSSVADALAVSVKSGPRAVSLQRCFRLGPAAAGDLLASAVEGGSRLQTLLLSHLDRLDLPRVPFILESLEDGTEKGTLEYVELVKSVVGRVPGTGLRILALHKCGSLGISELAAIAGTCPYLEIWMLGGSTEGLGLSRPDIIPPETVVTASSALLRAAKILPWLRILEITFFSTPVLSALRGQISPGIRVWDFCERNSVMAAARLIAHLRGCNIPSIGEEYTAVSPEDVSRPDWCIDGLSEELELINVNQFSEPWTVKRRQGSLGYDYRDERWDSSTSDMLLAFKAGTNCSDLRKRTPLHIAAARGDAVVVANLLFIGASAGEMKDSGGATALFLAAESGHAEVCGLLLKGGADVLVSNRVGETPLYIAALRGHSAAVEVMLAHCHKHGVSWQDANVYGDGWTPLMAATVAGRQDVAEVLLDFASASCPASLETQRNGLEATFKPEDVLDGEAETSAAQIRVRNESLGSRRIFASRLVDAQNRYGQTALHIAAKCKASTWFVDNLLHAGASLDVKDEYGYRPIDVARKVQHSTMEKTLRTWEQMHGKTARASTSGKSSRKKKSKHKKGSAAEEQNKASAEAQAITASDEEKMRDGCVSLEDTGLMLPAQLPSRTQEFPMDHC